MRAKSLNRFFAVLLLGGSLFGLSGCSDNASPTSPSVTPSTTIPVFPTTLAAEVVATMDEAIQDEFHAEFIYRRVLADFVNVPPFFNIVNAEERHSEAIAVLYRNHGLSVPASQWNIDNVPAFPSVREACGAAAQAEILNIELYDRFLETELPDDVETVFENNRRASLENHLPAFQGCAGN